MKINKYISGFLVILTTLLSASVVFATNSWDVDINKSVACGTGTKTISGTASYNNDSSSTLLVRLNGVNKIDSESEPTTWNFTDTLTVGQSYTVNAYVYDSSNPDVTGEHQDTPKATDTWTFTHQNCATPTPSSTPTPAPTSVNICHKAGQSGNYTHNTVSVHSVNDANGLDGHGDHDGDIWGPFTYNNVNYPGQGDYNGYNLTTCVPNSTPAPTSTPTSQPSYSPTATPTSVPSSTATATPTNKPCDGDCDPTSTPTATSVATQTPNSDLCANIDGIQYSVPEGKHLDASGKNCVEYGVPGPDSGTGGAQVLGTSTGQVLGASTMAPTGAVSDALFNSIFTLGSLLTSFGIMKNGKKKA